MRSCSHAGRVDAADAASVISANTVAMMVCACGLLASLTGVACRGAGCDSSISDSVLEKWGISTNTATSAMPPGDT